MHRLLSAVLGPMALRQKSALKPKLCCCCEVHSFSGILEHCSTAYLLQEAAFVKAPRLFCPTPQNLAVSLGVYGSICKELGLPFRWARNRAVAPAGWVSIWHGGNADCAGC